MNTVTSLALLIVFGNLILLGTAALKYLFGPRDDCRHCDWLEDELEDMREEMEALSKWKQRKDHVRWKRKNRKVVNKVVSV